MADRYSYRPVWSPKYQNYAACCFEFPTLASLGTTQPEALNQVALLVTEVIDAPTDQPPPDAAFESASSSVTRRPPRSARLVPRWRTRC
jgi:hypothetical protein